VYAALCLGAQAVGAFLFGGEELSGAAGACRASRRWGVTEARRVNSLRPCAASFCRGVKSINRSVRALEKSGREFTGNVPRRPPGRLLRMASESFGSFRFGAAGGPRDNLVMKDGKSESPLCVAGGASCD